MLKFSLKGYEVKTPSILISAALEDCRDHIHHDSEVY
jgi:hypothetical protein